MERIGGVRVCREIWEVIFGCYDYEMEIYGEFYEVVKLGYYDFKEKFICKVVIFGYYIFLE